MAENTKDYASSFILKRAQIYKVNSSQSYDITDLVVRFDYFESITMPTVSARLDMVDSGANLISSLPIQGFEKVVIELEDYLNETHEYEFRVYKIDNRFASDRFQKYTLGLVSLESLLNEGVRISKTLKGKPDEIVKELLEENLKTTKDVNVDPSLYNIIFNPGKKTPFNIISSIQPKAVYQSSNVTTDSSSATARSVGEKTDVTSSLDLVTDAKYSKANGSAGYLFYETKNGYYFKSIDSLCSNKNEVKATYYQENKDVNSTTDRKILDIDFINEIDILEKLRMGAYSSIICSYNFSTGGYEEIVYSLAESYENMEHLGSQQTLPYGQAELSKYPTRVMSILLDHETWYNGTGIASPDSQDGSTGKTTSYPDFQKHYISQSISRYNSLVNQKVKITIPGNPTLCVGDKIEIKIPNQVTSQDKVSEPYDPEHSGVYLIAEINHAFDPKIKRTNSFLTLVRDSYGQQDTVSKVQ